MRIETFHVGIVSDSWWRLWVGCVWVVRVTVLGAGGSTVGMMTGAAGRAAVGVLWRHRCIVGMTVAVAVAVMGVVVTKRHDADEIDEEPSDRHKLHTTTNTDVL